MNLSKLISIPSGFVHHASMQCYCAYSGVSRLGAYAIRRRALPYVVAIVDVSPGTALVTFEIQLNESGLRSTAAVATTRRWTSKR